MALTAHLFWKRSDNAFAEVQFAYPLREGDQFVLRTEADPLVCTVETAVHYPVATGSNADPSVAYYVSATAASKMGTWWWSAKHTLGAVLKGQLKLK